MIKAKHNKFAIWIFNHYISRLLKKHFHAFYLLNEPPLLEANVPLLLLPNHSTWWDGFYIHLLNTKYFQRRLYLMMLERELRQNPFFAKVGAYSIRQHSTTGVRESLKYTRSLLTTPTNNLVCMFPQGKLQPWNVNPLRFQRGIEFILESLNTTLDISLLGIRAEMLDEQLPDVFLKFKLVTNPIGSVITARELETQMAQLLQEMDRDINNRKLGSLFMQGTLSINRKRQHRKKQPGQ